MNIRIVIIFKGLMLSLDQPIQSLKITISKKHCQNPQLNNANILTRGQLDPHQATLSQIELFCKTSSPYPYRDPCNTADRENELEMLAEDSFVLLRITRPESSRNKL
uniref:Uncharacterized protein n=1 Tax=Glossina pallidipes TaxID=7398 RepID=A0A1A9ZM03_GLOPL